MHETHNALTDLVEIGRRHREEPTLIRSLAAKPEGIEETAVGTGPSTPGFGPHEPAAETGSARNQAAAEVGAGELDLRRTEPSSSDSAPPIIGKNGREKRARSIVLVGGHLLRSLDPSVDRRRERDPPG